MKNDPRTSMTQVVREIKELYTASKNQSDLEFDQTAASSVWPSAMRRMRADGKNMVEILQETTPLELLSVINRYEKNKKIIEDKKNGY